MVVRDDSMYKSHDDVGLDVFFILLQRGKNLNRDLVKTSTMGFIMHT